MFNNKIITKTTIYIILLGFVLSGLVGVVSIKSSDHCVFTIKEKCIQYEEFNKYYKSNIYDNLNHKDKINKIIQDMTLKLNLEDKMRKYKLFMSDKLISRILLEDQNFQKDNKFDFEKFDNFLKSNNITSEEIRNSISMNIFQSLILKGVLNFNIPENEKFLNSKWSLFSDKYEIEYSIYNISSIKDNIKYTEEEILNKYNENKTLFQITKSIDVDYVLLNEKTLNKKGAKKCEFIEKILLEKDSYKGNINILNNKHKLTINSKIFDNKNDEFGIFNQNEKMNYDQNDIHYQYLNKNDCDVILFKLNKINNARELKLEEVKDMIIQIIKDDKKYNLAIQEMKNGSDKNITKKRVVIDPLNLEKISEIELYILNKMINLKKGDKLQNDKIGDYIVSATLIERLSNNKAIETNFRNRSLRSQVYKFIYFFMTDSDYNNKDAIVINKELLNNF